MGPLAEATHLRQNFWIPRPTSYARRGVLRMNHLTSPSRHQSFTDCTIDTLPTPTTPTTIETMEHSQLTSLQLSPSSPVSPLMSSRRRSRRACVGFVALAVGKSSGSDTCWLAWWIVKLLQAVPSKLACVL